MDPSDGQTGDRFSHPGADRNRAILFIAFFCLIFCWLKSASAMMRWQAATDDPAARPVESFENGKPGAFEQLETSVGTWKPVAGSTIIDDRHATTGKQCLQITGGERSAVILDIAEGLDTSGRMTFRAERWTARSPFSFRIEKNSGQGWQEIFNGDQSIRVGRSFLNHVRVPLDDPDIRQLRWTVTSPPETGVLIDDLAIVPPQRQSLVKIEEVPFTLPALVGTTESSLFKLRIVTRGYLKPISLVGLQARIHGGEKMRELRLEVAGSEKATSLKLPPDEQPADWKLPEMVLAEGENIVWLKCTLRELKSIDGTVGATVEELRFSNGRTIPLETTPSHQRLGVSVRNGGDDGVHTYRIPGLATTKKGTLIAVYDVRRRGGGDLPGDIDVGMSRSIDGGHTWKPMKIIMDMGDDPDWRYDGIGDPAVLVDRQTGTIWVAGVWSHGNRGWHGSGPGLSPEETGQLMLVRSNDDGRTWSRPINITSQVKKPEWCFLLQGPGKGITMRDGTLVFAAQYQDTPANRRLPHSTIIYSQDRGETWKVGTGAFPDTTEAQVVEIEPGVLMLNCRYNREPRRVVMITRDLGRTWEKHPTSQRDLIEPQACMASLIDVGREVDGDGGGWLLFSNPDSSTIRQRMMIKASADRGLNWPREHQLLLDENRSAGYSCLTMIDENTVGILYEGSQAHLTFQRIALAELNIRR